MELTVHDLLGDQEPFVQWDQTKERFVGRTMSSGGNKEASDKGKSLDR